MHPALRVVIAVVGAAFGANLSSSGSTLLGAALGALAGLGLGEAITLRVAIQKLRAELADLRTEEITRQAQKEALAKITLPPQRTSPVAPPIPSAAFPRSLLTRPNNDPQRALLNRHLSPREASGLARTRLIRRRVAAKTR